jgi:hypothetical protein
MKPLAKLTVNRQRLYQKSCVNEDLSVPFSDAENDMYIDMRETTQETGSNLHKPFLWNKPNDNFLFDF